MPDADTTRERWRLLTRELHLERGRLADYLRNPEAEDTLEWVLGYLRSFLSIERWPDRTSSQTTLQELIALADSGGSRELAHELLDRAFLDFEEFQSALGRQGVLVMPFPEETEAEKRRRLLNSAKLIRDGLTEDDWARLEVLR